MLIPNWPALQDIDRRAMLTHLMHIIMKQTYPKELSCHIRDGKLHDFCASIANARTDKGRSQIIAKTAKADVLDNPTNLETVSVQGLWLSDEHGVDCRVKIFRLSGASKEGAVCVQYIDTPTIWEGTCTVSGKHFQLTMNVDDGRLFDGSNGTLRCDDGVVIPCFLKDLGKRPNSD